MASGHSDRIVSLENMNPAPRMDLCFFEWVSSATGNVIISMKSRMILGSLVYNRIMEECPDFMDPNRLCKPKNMYKMASHTSNTKL